MNATPEGDAFIDLQAKRRAIFPAVRHPVAVLDDLLAGEVAEHCLVFIGCGLVAADGTGKTGDTPVFQTNIADWQRRESGFRIWLSMLRRGL